MNQLRNIIIALVLAGGVGYGWGRYKTPAKVETVEKQVIVKETEVIVREVKQADGTIIKETITKDTARKENDKSNKTVNEKHKYSAGIVVGYDFDKKKENYGAIAQARLGDTPFMAGVLIKSSKDVSAVLTLEF